MDNNRFHYLLEAYTLDQLTKEQATELLQLLNAQPGAAQLEELVTRQLEEKTYDQDVALPHTHQRIMAGLQATINAEKQLRKTSARAKVRSMRFRRMAAAAILLLVAGGAWLFFHNKTAKHSATDVAVAVNDVNPGHAGAQLKLSDDRVILIDTAKEGLIARDGNMAIYKRNGAIEYEGGNGSVVYNEMVTDKGRQYSAVLPDGSVVWLNAMSSLRYPLHFSGAERAVTLTGEGKFKVVHNDRQPFRVYIKTANGEVGRVEDLGTEFNINAYSNENDIRTSVVEGRVAVSAIKVPAVHLKAGQQARMNNNKINVVNDADIDQAVAWANGVFAFNGETIEGVMRQLTRWYDVDVVYEAKPGNALFAGEIGMNQTLSQVLRGLASMSIKFRIENKRIVVMP